MHVAVYAGIPAANSAFALARTELPQTRDAGARRGRGGRGVSDRRQMRSTPRPRWPPSGAPRRMCAGCWPSRPRWPRRSRALGVIPAKAAKAIRAACRVETFDVAALYREAALAGSPAIPLARMLTERVGETARGYVHWGATSQDVIDTALVLQMRAGLDLLRAACWPSVSCAPRWPSATARRRWLGARCCSRRCRSPSG